jgi:hypothetical protein
VLEDLLSTQELGVLATGFIESAETPTLVSGISAKGGRPYAFWNRRITLKVNKNGQTVLIAQSRDNEADFEPLDFSSIVTFTIGGARMDGSQMVLREETPEQFRRK